MTVHLPVVPTQGAYRQLLQAMSHPGRLYAVPSEPWPSLLMAVCQTLLDHEVSYCVAPGADMAWEQAIFAATKARRTPVEEADYLIVRGHDSGGAVEHAQIGVPPFPDQGATILYVMDAPYAKSAAGAPYLSGPGIAEDAPPMVNPLASAEWNRLREINSEYPLGVDALCLIGHNQVMAIPRSTRIRTE